MVKHLLSVKPEEPVASRILQDFETYMTGFVSLPVNIPGTSYAKAVKVIKAPTYDIVCIYRVIIFV